MVWKKVTEKNTIAANSGKEFDINGKKLLFSIKMDIMHWTEYVYIKTTQSLQANLTVTLWNVHHIFGITILKQVNFKII